MRAGMGDLRELCGRRDVDDQWVPAGALLGLEDARHGHGIEGMGAQPVDGLRGKGDRVAGAQKLGRAPEVCGVRGAEALGLAAAGHWCAV